MSLRLSDHKVLHNIASPSSFFRFRSDFLAFFAPISYFKFLEFKEFNKTIIPIALVGYETRWLFTISYPTHVHGIIVKYPDSLYKRYCQMKIIMIRSGEVFCSYLQSDKERKDILFSGDGRRACLKIYST